MDTDFWLTRWQRNETGFHRQQHHPWLAKHQPALQLQKSAHDHSEAQQPKQAHPINLAHVFVPLCGKSVDLQFLASAGARVTGIELSPIAVEDFFLEHGLLPTKQNLADFVLYEAGNIRIFCGDFFALTPALLGDVDAVWDRAALIALPDGMRRDYAAHMTTLLGKGARYLLVGFDYPQAEMAGPPFSVPQAEIRRLFSAHFDIAALDRADILDAEPRFRERGLTRLTETCWLLVRR